eukprot:6191186-Pleurochrysis_carterae.AAC.4
MGSSTADGRARRASFAPSSPRRMTSASPRPWVGIATGCEVGTSEAIDAAHVDGRSASAADADLNAGQLGAADSSGGRLRRPHRG